MDRPERLALFLNTLELAPPSSNCETALSLISETLNAIEDQHSGVPYNPDTWQTDGRMYPPQLDQEKVSDRPHCRLFRSKGHRIYIGANGAIRIERVKGKDRILVLDKAGADGCRCP